MTSSGLTAYCSIVVNKKGIANGAAKMTIGIPKETNKKERRVPLIPETVKKIVDLGADCIIEKGMGAAAGYNDAAYAESGAKISARRSLLSASDVILRLEKPPEAEIERLKSGAVHISYLDPFNEKKLVRALADRGVNAISMEMIPRITRAQKMDSLSSQASLAGYVSVILAADKFDRILPMMVTPAGTLTPARVFVIGAGVAGLQAIATAHRLGARVEAFDTRSVVEEQVQSLGARFVKVDLGEIGQTKDGYAKELTEEQLAKQQEIMAKHCAASDVVITTAQVFGRKAPRILTKEMVARMRPGSIIIDMAVESGGNVEGSKLDQEVDVGGVKIVGYSNLAGMVPVHASQMYSSNIGNLVMEFWDKEKKMLVLDVEDEILKGCLITRDGQVWNERLKEKYNS